MVFRGRTIVAYVAGAMLFVSAIDAFVHDRDGLLAAVLGVVLIVHEIERHFILKNARLEARIERNKSMLKIVESLRHGENRDPAHALVMLADSFRLELAEMEKS